MAAEEKLAEGVAALGVSDGGGGGAAASPAASLFGGGGAGLFGAAPAASVFSFADAATKLKPGNTVSKRIEGVDASQTWSPTDASKFSVRCGPDYKKNGTKAPSAAAFYDVVSVDIIDSGSTLQTHVAERMDLPEAPPQAECGPLPPLFIVNWQMPYNAPAIQGAKKVEKAPGSNAIIVCKISAATLEEVKKPVESWSAALRLLVNFVEKAATDKAVKECFKAISIVDNISELKLGSFIEGYNGKPVLITKSGQVFQGEGYLEFDINVHVWNMMARKTLKSLQPNVSRMTVDSGFVIQGTADDELPEIMLAACRLHRCRWTVGTAE